ncbi:MAG: hypothetical protein KDB69_08660, partial [Acidimicrobiia bacterium]|nr:hypothetical protein [Acidimicrobiia bacterium]
MLAASLAGCATSDQSAPDTNPATSTSPPSSSTTTTTLTDSSTTSQPSGAGKGTIDDPIAGGDFAQVGDWRVRVIGVSADATADVLAENQFNDEPDEGKQFFIATLEAEYTGTDSGTAWADLTWKALGPSAVAYESLDSYCGVIPDGLSDAGETFPGGVVIGNVCWSVTSDDAANLVMLLEESFSFDST